MPQSTHALMRAKERYGIDFTPHDLSKIAKSIQRNEGTLDRSRPWTPGRSGRSVWFLEYQGHRLRVVMSPDFYSVVTFIPLEDAWIVHRPQERTPPRKPPPRAKKKRRKKIWLNGRERYVEVAA